MRSSAINLFVVAIAAVGCSKTPSPTLQPASASPAAGAAPASAQPQSRERQLALMAPEGAGPTESDIRHLQSMIGTNPEKVDNWIVLGQRWVEEARETADPAYYANAAACADEALKMAPNRQDAADLQGMVALNDHRFEDARKIASAVVAKTPDDVTAFGILSDALLETGHYPESADAAQKMMDLKPALPSYSRASYEMWIRGDTQGAKESAKLAMDSGRDSKHPEPWCWVTVQAAMIFWHQGDYLGANAGFDRALELIPDYAPALVGKGMVAIAQGDGKTAVELLQKAWAKSPLVPTIWLLGDAQTLAGDAAGAQKSNELVVKHGREIDHRNLALFYATKNRDLEEALKLINAEKLIRDDIYTEDALAWVLYRKGQFADARAASDKAMQLNTPDARLMYHAGAIRLAQGDKGGLDLVKKAVALNPKFDFTGGPEAAALANR